MKRIVVHLGAHKTGTTSFQSWFEEHKHVLQDKMYCYNLHDGSSEPLKHACYALVRSDGCDHALRRCLRWMNWQIRCLRQDTVLVTDEGILGPPLGWSSRKKKISTAYQYAELIVRAISEEWSDYDVTFIFYQREKQAWLKSAWGQMNREGRFKNSLEKFNRRYGGDFSWEEISTQIEAGIIRPHKFELVNFDDEFSTQSVADKRLVQLLGLPDSLLASCSNRLSHSNRTPDQIENKKWWQFNL